MIARRQRVGDTWRFPLYRTDAAGTPVPLTGLTITAAVKDGDGQITTFTTVLTDAENGRAEIVLSSDETADLGPGVHEMEIEFRDAAVVPNEVISCETITIVALENIANAS